MASVVSPIDGSLLATVPAATLSDVDAAFGRAADAAQGWARCPASTRGRLLATAARLMAERADEIAEIETQNVGKTPADTRREAHRAAACFAYYAGYADKALGSAAVPGPGLQCLVHREPRGVTVGVIPWNVPYFFAAKKIAPALAFGNVTLLKPAEETPLTALALAGILEEAGLPEGVVQVVPGGRETGTALVGDPRADLVVFTGSDATGKAVATAAAANLTPVCLELGGKSPQLVFDDADLDAVTDHVLLGAFGAAGQMCVAGSRLYVQETVATALLERIAGRVRVLRVGRPQDPGTNVGPQVTRAQRDKTLAMIATAQDEGARLVAQAALPTDPALRSGFYAPPTVFADVDPGMTVMRQEVFGPVLAFATFSDEDDALAKAHETEFGLAAGVWTRDAGRAHRLAAALDVGNVWINCYRVLSDLVPFGGVGRSGYGREGGDSAVRLYTRPKTVVIGHEPSPLGGAL